MPAGLQTQFGFVLLFSCKSHVIGGMLHRGVSVSSGDLSVCPALILGSHLI